MPYPTSPYPKTFYARDGRMRTIHSQAEEATLIDEWFPAPPSRVRSYPTMLYARDGRTLTVHSPAEKDALTGEWFDSPADFGLITAPSADQREGQGVTHVPAPTAYAPDALAPHAPGSLPASWTPEAGGGALLHPTRLGEGDNERSPMPQATSQAQRAMAVEDLRRMAAGEEPRTGMTKEQLEELAHTPDVHDLPERAAAQKKGKG